MVYLRAIDQSKISYKIWQRDSRMGKVIPKTIQSGF